MKKIFSWIVLIVLLIGVIFAYDFYKKHNFNQFNRAESNLSQSFFLRDDETKYTKDRSYMIESEYFNDALYYIPIKVKPNTSYRVTAKVKTENVVKEKEVSSGGASIGIMDTVEISKSVTGTNDWEELEFIFNSKNREEVNIAFRLGGYNDNCTGKAWFTDFKLEEGKADNSTNWKMLLLVFHNTDVNIDINGNLTNVKVSMNQNDVNVMKTNMERFKNSIRTLSNYSMEVEYDIKEINVPITTLSYDKENGYYVDSRNIEDVLKQEIKEEYDHIFVAVRLGDKLSPNEVPTYDWIGLRRNGLLWNRLF